MKLNTFPGMIVNRLSLQLFVQIMQTAVYFLLPV